MEKENEGSLVLKDQNVDGKFNGKGLEDLTNKLNYHCLLKLFSFLPRDDIVTVQRVCHSWRGAAQDKSLWNNYTLFLTCTPIDKKNIIMMPALLNIDGYTKNRILRVILNNVMDLKKLNCVFIPRMSSTQVQDVLEKYPELESINVNMYSSDILETMNKLKISQHLKEIIFNCAGFNFDPLLHETKTLLIFEILADSLNFPELTNLNLTKFHLEDLKNSSLSILVADVIRKRSEKLFNLKYSYLDSLNAPILNSISMCTKLKRLHLSVHNDNIISFNLDNVTHLESLYIYSGRNYNVNCPKMLQHIFTNGSWTHLLELNLNFSSFQNLNIFKLILECAKNLKILEYTEYFLNGGAVDESHLEKIGDLSKLEILDVGFFENLTEKGLEYLSGCSNLIGLNLITLISTVEKFPFHVAKMITHMPKLTKLKINICRQNKRNVNLCRREINSFLKTHLSV